MSNIAVFLASSIRKRASDTPGHMFLTFQLATQMADNFLTFVFVLSGAVCQSTCQTKILSSFEVGGAWRKSTLADWGLLFLR